MRLRASVKRSTGKTRHSIGTLIDGIPTPIHELPVPARVEISDEEMNGGYYLFYLDEKGECFADGWHETLGEAKRQAQFEFEIKPEEWIEVES